jgi:TctA family transporter
LLLSKGDMLFLVQRPISGTILALTVIILLWPLIKTALPRKRMPAPAEL